MYAISSDNGRRASQTGPQRPELPILFHLTDVSRPRAAAKDAVADRTAEPAKTVELLSPVIAPPPAAASATLQAAVVEKAMPFSAPAAVNSEAVAAEVIEPPIELIASGAKLSPGNIAVSKPAAAEEPILLEVAESANPATATVTLKPKSAERRQRRTPASEDWFASHGKFLAIGFVVALMGTVYFARTTRQQATLAKTETATQSPLAEHSSSDSPAATAPIASKSIQTVAAVSDSKVELWPPSAPALISSTSSTEKAGGSDKLFEFPAMAKAEQRVAAKPATGGSEPKNEQSPAAPESAAGAAGLAPAYPVTTSPATYPAAGVAPSAYPQTAYPQTSAPALQGPANAAPNYRSQFPTQPPQQPAAPQPSPPTSGWSPPTGGPAPSQYQQMNNTARGPRYEFTGSGRY